MPDETEAFPFAEKWTFIQKALLVALIILLIFYITAAYYLVYEWQWWSGGELAAVTAALIAGTTIAVTAWLYLKIQSTGLLVIIGVAGVIATLLLFHLMNIGFTGIKSVDEASLSERNLHQQVSTDHQQTSHEITRHTTHDLDRDNREAARRLQQLHDRRGVARIKLGDNVVGYVSDAEFDHTYEAWDGKLPLNTRLVVMASDDLQGGVLDLPYNVPFNDNGLITFGRDYEVKGGIGNDAPTGYYQVTSMPRDTVLRAIYLPLPLVQAHRSYTRERMADFLGRYGFEADVVDVGTPDMSFRMNNLETTHFFPNTMYILLKRR